MSKFITRKELNSGGGISKDMPATFDKDVPAEDDVPAGGEEVHDEAAKVEAGDLPAKDDVLAGGEEVDVEPGDVEVGLLCLAALAFIIDSFLFFVL